MQLTRTSQRRWIPGRDACAFTLTELCVVVGIIVVLAAVVLPTILRSNHHVLRARCVANLREIGVGLNVYSADAADYYPVCGWPEGQNPWQTYSAARVVPGTSTVTRGFMSLGLLFRTKTVRDPKLFYCPGLSLNSSTFTFTYDRFSTAPNGWPSTPVGSGEEQIRTGYNYYPQLRATVQLGGHAVPKLTYSSSTLEFGGTFNLVTPAKWFALNPKKSIVTDLVHSLSFISHPASGSIAGLNANFPDGGVVFQNARNNPQAFDPVRWGSSLSSDYAGVNASNFRYIMSLWKPE